MGKRNTSVIPNNVKDLAIEATLILSALLVLELLPPSMIAGLAAQKLKVVESFSPVICSREGDRSPGRKISLVIDRANSF